MVWRPAHQNAAAIGHRIKSNGKRLSCIDFRANRLVDKLAAHFAKPSLKAKEGEKLVNDIRVASTCALATLGQVTWAANNCPIEEENEEGVKITKIQRDSCDRPKTKTAKKRPDLKASEKPKEGEMKQSQGKAEEFNAK